MFEFDINLCGFLKRLLGPQARLVPRFGPFAEQSGPAPPNRARVSPSPGKRYLLMAFQLTDSQQTTMTIKPVDRRGNPAPTDGPAEWLVDNPNVLSLTPSADGLSCLVAAVGPLGPATVTVKVDANLDPNATTELIGTLDVEVVGGAATTITIDPGTPEESPETP